MAKERRIVSFLDMVLVPKARLAHSLAIARMPEPADTRRIQRLPLKIAEKRDRIALDVAATAFRTGLVINRESEERHGANDLAHFAFEGGLACAHIGRRIAAATPALKI